MASVYSYRHFFLSATPKWHEAELPLWSAVVPSLPIQPQVSPRWAASTEDGVIGVSTQAKGDSFSGRRWGFASGFKVPEQSHCSCTKGDDVLLSCWGKEGCPGWGPGATATREHRGACAGEPVGRVSITARQEQISVVLSQGLEFTVCVWGSSEMWLYKKLCGFELL